MITKKELNPTGIILTKEQEGNFEKLFKAMNMLRAYYGRPMIITSGVRTEQMQMRINPSNPNSAHRQAGACDVNDPEKELSGWCIDNLDKIVECDLYLEHRYPYMRHQHFQVIAPKSGRRIFLP